MVLTTRQSAALHFTPISIMYANPQSISMDNLEMASLLELILNGFYFRFASISLSEKN